MAVKNKNLIVAPSNKQRRWFYAGFIAINLFLSCYYLDVWITPNTASRAVPVLSMYEDKTLMIDKYAQYAVDVSQINSHYYSNKAPFTSFLVYPFYLIYKGIGLPELKDSTLKKYPIYIDEDIKPDYDGRTKLLPKSSPILIIGDILCGTIPFVLALLLSLFALKKNDTKISPVVLVMLTFYASFIFAYSGTYTSHILAGIFALSSYILLKKKNYLFSGILIGIAMAIEYPVGILIPAWVLFIYLHERKFSKPLLFAAGVAPALLFVLYYNYHLTGSFFKTSYSFETHQHKQATSDVGFYFPAFSAFWGLIFSTYRGVLYYTPVLIFIIWYGIKYGYQNVSKELSNKMGLVKKVLMNYFFITVAVYVLLYCSYYEWAGGWAFGPRYLIPLVIIILYEGVLFLSKKRFSYYIFYVVAGIGLLITWMDKSTKIFQIPSNPKSAGNPIFDIIIPDFFKHRFNSNTLPVFIFDANPVLSVYVWPLLFIAGLIVLTMWYAKLYTAKKNSMNILLPALPFFVLYLVVIIPQFTFGKNNLKLNSDGIFGVWKNYELANIYMEAGQDSKAANKKVQYYIAAIDEYKKVIKATPTFQDCYFGLGVCYSGIGISDSAIHAYKQALCLNPKYSMAAKNLGIIYSKGKIYEEAIKYFIIAYNADSNLGALMDIGASYQLAGNKPKAQYYDSLVLLKDPNNRATLFNLAGMHDDMGLEYLDGGKLDEALYEFSIAQKYSPTMVDPIVNSGKTYEEKGNIDMARYYYRKALSKAPGNPELIKDIQMLDNKHHTH